jgi:phytoene/squalene synthetase
MMRIYRALLDRIEREPRRVLVSRVTLSRPAKLAIAARAMWRRSWTPATPDGQSD